VLADFNVSLRSRAKREEAPDNVSAQLAAIRHNAGLRVVYDRLLAAGKPKKLALTAAIRKLIVILNAMLRDGTPWRAPQSA
jgi:hypothetical protein